MTYNSWTKTLWLLVALCLSCGSQPTDVQDVLDQTSDADTPDVSSDSDQTIDADPDAATSLSGFPPRSQLAARYGERTGRDLSLLDYYIGFNHWKSACIIHGVYARYMEGKKSTEGVDLEGLRASIDGLLSASREAVNRLG